MEENTLIDDEIIQGCIEKIILSQEDNYKCQYKLLTQNQALLLLAVAKEQCIKEPMSGQFIHKYHLKSSSSVQRALQYLLDEEFLYSTESGYIVYDRFMAIWLAAL